MPGLRKGHCYSKVKRSYTRKSKFKGKDYVKAIPAIKIVRFDIGDVNKKFTHKVSLVSLQDIQIRDNALESCRQIVNRNLTDSIGTNYYFQIKAYPHHVLRENKMITGAGADRMQTGMQLAFGRAIGIAAQLRKGKELFSVRVNEESVEKAKDALSKATPRLPGRYNISVEKIN